MFHITEVICCELDSGIDQKDGGEKWTVDYHTVALLLWFTKWAKSAKNKPRAEASLAKRSTRKQC